MTEPLVGRCLCGAVHYMTDAEPMLVGHCYCVDCRKASGTDHGTHVGVPEAAFTLSGEVKAFESAADSGSMIARNFCPECGCAVFSRNSSMPGMIFIRASSLDDPSQVTPQLSVYAASAPDWAVFDTSKPVFDLMPEGGPQSAATTQS